MHNPGSNGRKYAQSRIYGQHGAQPWIPEPAAANVGKSISAGTVGSCDPWEPSWNLIE